MGSPWSDALGHDKKGYLQITRLLNVDGKFSCYSQFIVRMSRFSGLRRVDHGPEQSVNLRRILDEDLGAPTIGVTQHIKIVKFPNEICDQLSIDYGSTGLRIDAVGNGYGGVANFFHRILVPSSDYTLDMTQDINVRID